MKLNLTPNKIDWTALMPRLKEYQPQYDALADHQKDQFSCLLKLSYSFVGTHVGEKEFFDERQFIWNTNKWLGILLKLSDVKECVNPCDYLVSMLPQNPKSKCEMITM